MREDEIKKLKIKFQSYERAISDEKMNKINNWCNWKYFFFFAR